MCKVRVAQCVYIAQSGSKSQTSIEQAPNFVVGCGAPLVPGVSGVSGVWVCLVYLCAARVCGVVCECACVSVCVRACVCECVCVISVLGCGVFMRVCV